MKNKKTIAQSILLAGIFLFVGCKQGIEPKTVIEDPKDAPSFKYNFETPSNYTVTKVDGGVNIFFDPNPTADHFMLYFDDTEGELDGFPGSIGSPVATSFNSIMLKGSAFTPGETYYFAVSAADSDGTETTKTSTNSVTIDDLPGVAYTFNVELNTCINESVRFVFEDGMLKLENQSGGKPGQDNKCKFQNADGDNKSGTWVKLTPSGSGNSYVFPADGTNQPHNFDNGAIDLSPTGAHPIFSQMVTTEEMVITEFETKMDEKCPGTWSGKRYEVIQEGPGKVLFDLRNCGDEKWEKFYFGDAIKFKLTFQSMAQ